MQKRMESKIYHLKIANEEVLNKVVHVETRMEIDCSDSQNVDEQHCVNVKSGKWIYSGTYTINLAEEEEEGVQAYDEEGNTVTEEDDEELGVIEKTFDENMFTAIGNSLGLNSEQISSYIADPVATSLTGVVLNDFGATHALTIDAASEDVVEFKSIFENPLTINFSGRNFVLSDGNIDAKMSKNEVSLKLEATMTSEDDVCSDLNGKLKLKLPIHEGTAAGKYYSAEILATQAKMESLVSCFKSDDF